MNGPNQFADSIFGPRSFLPLRSITFCPTSNSFLHFSVTRRTIRGTLADFAIATSNSHAKSVLKATKSSWGASNANLGLIPKRISKRDFPSITGRVQYFPSICPKQSSQLRSFLLTKTLCTARFNVPNILSTLQFPFGLYAEIIFQSIYTVEA